MAGPDHGEYSCKLHALWQSNCTSRHQSECDDGLDAIWLGPRVAMNLLLQKQGYPNSLETRIPGILSAISIRIGKSYKRSPEVDLDKLERDVEEDGDWITREDARFLCPLYVPTFSRVALVPCVRFMAMSTFPLPKIAFAFSGSEAITAL